MSREANQEWDIRPDSNGGFSWPAAQLAVLQDIRDELRRIRIIAECPNTTAIPALLRSIKRNTSKKRKKAVKK